MDIFFAGEFNLEHYLPENINILLSYWYTKNNFKKRTQILDNYKGTKVFIDSGAFTAWTKGVTLNVDEYIDWLNTYDNYLYLFGQVDTIPGDINLGATEQEVNEAAQKTWENYLYMRNRVLSPDKLLYTFHVGEPFEYLKHALEWEDENGSKIKYMAFGGMVGKPAPVRNLFLEKCYDIIKCSSNPNIKCHAFGMTDLNLLNSYPITSADSTSWLVFSNYGAITSKYGVINLSKKEKNSKNSVFRLPEQSFKELNKEIQEFGFTLEELEEDYLKRRLYNIRFFKKECEKINVKYRKKNKLF